MIARRVIWLRWLEVYAVAAILFGLSSIPGSRLPRMLFPQQDKVEHAIAYALFAVLIFRALWADEARTVPKWALVLGVALASAYGASDEFHQYFVPGRSCDVIDWMADTAGPVIAAIAWTPLIRRFGWMK